MTDTGKELKDKVCGWTIFGYWLPALPVLLAALLGLYISIHQFNVWKKHANAKPTASVTMHEPASSTSPTAVAQCFITPMGDVGLAVRQEGDLVTITLRKGMTSAYKLEQLTPSTCDFLPTGH